MSAFFCRARWIPGSCTSGLRLMLPSSEHIPSPRPHGTQPPFAGPYGIHLSLFRRGSFGGTAACFISDFFSVLGIEPSIYYRNQANSHWLHDIVFLPLPHPALRFRSACSASFLPCTSSPARPDSGFSTIFASCSNACHMYFSMRDYGNPSGRCHSHSSW